MRDGNALIGKGGKRKPWQSTLLGRSGGGGGRRCKKNLIFRNDHEEIRVFVKTCLEN